MNRVVERGVLTRQRREVDVADCPNLVLDAVPCQVLVHFPVERDGVDNGHQRRDAYCDARGEHDRNGESPPPWQVQLPDLKHGAKKNAEFDNEVRYPCTEERHHGRQWTIAGHLCVPELADWRALHADERDLSYSVLCFQVTRA